MSTASYAASDIAHHWPTTTFLRPPTVVGLPSVGTSMVVPAAFKVPPPFPQDGLHPQTHFQVAIEPSVSPTVVPVSKDVGNAAETILAVVVVLVLAGGVIVAVFDAAGRLLARVG